MSLYGMIYLSNLDQLLQLATETARRLEALGWVRVEQKLETYLRAMNAKTKWAPTRLKHDPPGTERPRRAKLMPETWALRSDVEAACTLYELDDEARQQEERRRKIKRMSYMANYGADTGLIYEAMQQQRTAKKG